VAAAIAERMEQVGLRLHPGKTRIVYCKDGKRRGSYEHTSFTFLGFTFQQRRVTGQERKTVQFNQSRNQQGRPEPARRTGAVMATASSHRPYLR